MDVEGRHSVLNDSITVELNSATPKSTGEEGENSLELAHFEFILFSIVVPVLFGLTTLIGLIGNTLVIYVILSSQKMRTITNLLLLNLACADLAFVTICPPFTAYQFATYRWPFGTVACKLLHYLLNVTAYVTVYTLVLISVIRYMTIVHNAQTIRFRARNNIVIMIIGIWMIMCAVNVPILLSYGTQLLDPEDPSQGIYCDNWNNQVGQRLYATFFCFAYILPLAMVALLSILILRHIKKQGTTMLNNHTKSQNKKRLASRLLIMVVLIFALFWLPIHIHLLVAYFGDIPQNPVYLAISVFWNVLAYFNSCVNPFIYNYASKEFRDGFRDTVCRKSHRQLAQDETHNGPTDVTAVNVRGKGNDRSSIRLLSGENGKT
jgi:hypothetical protein